MTKYIAWTIWIVAVATVIALIACTILSVNWHPEDSVVLVFNDDGHGSGAIIGPDTVLTAKHVALEPGLRVQTADGMIYEVRDVEFDLDDDLAVLYIRGEFTQKPLELCATPFKQRELICAIGTPYEHDLMNCVFSGRVVKTDYSTMVDMQWYENLDVIDAHIGRGCSGGPVLDMRGRVRGVIVTMYGSIVGVVPVEE